MINKRSMRIRTKKLGVLITDARTVAGKSIEDCAGVLDMGSWTMSIYYHRFPR